MRVGAFFGPLADGALCFDSQRCFAIEKGIQKYRAKFVYFYLLTIIPKRAIMYTESEGNTMKNKWTWIDSQQVGCIWYDDYTNEDGTLCKRVWMDGEEEIWKIG